MHPQNFYRYNPPNFKILANKYPSFDKFIVNKTEKIFNIDWKDPNATREFTRVLLDHDFGLKIELPEDYLCPTITLRSNYLYWLNEKLNDLGIDVNNVVKGIDIGTGASCIFPLLGVKLFKNWSFLGLDIDDSSLKFAKKNIELNSLESKISLFKNENKEKILFNYFQANQGEEKNEEVFDFCLCNPPFFNDLSETNINPKSTCTGSANELVTEGGEFIFIKKIIEESIVLKSKIKFYSSMVGRKCNLKPLLDLLKKNFGLPNSKIFTAELSQGNTHRWVMGWIVDDSFQPSSINNNKKLNNNNNNNDSNYNRNSDFLTRLERRKFYREGLMKEFNNDSSNKEEIINSLNNHFNKNKIIINDNSRETDTTGKDEKIIECKSFLNNLVNQNLDEEIEFSFRTEIKYIQNKVLSILLKPIEPPEDGNKQIINSNLFYIKKLFQSILDNIK
ncbi:hypothetical protein DICPUDRAFT_25940 [Dictyostelium purpureum]|uniref:U6 small nuclear RNA (adenine-(43)-N(6))-methyltransferase n=1 Tax=Dictyostelium purpureum TaxID=5786 RepID=F0Z7X6_DICPU|nr:uncharacterized protein DICPUDRAFT_25940 [Dictyostelium purpureum]EGC39986.1 hypothetical protein DICPUDRAFT_25940 [Dictyostelium purpureum]|eukprot:XP_003283489.1 hypothetical protein DICPUDRAFT_25940 [Dictyostelium purpureum]